MISCGCLAVEGEVCAGVPPARILVESLTESEWCARHLLALGHEVIVADPNFAPVYANYDRRTKTDRRDAWVLCEAHRQTLDRQLLFPPHALDLLPL